MLELRNLFEHLPVADGQIGQSHQGLAHAVGRRIEFDTQTY
jgi:hypothetical protein